MPTVRVGLLAFEGCDAMDLVGPYEVFLTAERLARREDREVSFEVLVVGERCATYGGLGVVPTHTVEQAEGLDVLVVPGAVDVDAAEPDAMIAALARTSDVLASVCTGSFFLHRCGLADGLELTTHWEDADALAALGAQVRTDVRWVDAGRVVSSGGISSGIAMALHLVERFADHGLAQATAGQIDYVWTERR